MKRREFLALFVTLALAPAGICLPREPDFSGTWRQSNDRCVPKRKGEVTRRIDQNGSALVVETTALRSSGPLRHAVQRYTVGGPVSVSTGIDGDEFHTSVARNGGSLVFSIEEHEDGRILHAKETWTLVEDGAALEVMRESLDTSADEARNQMLIYLRLPQQLSQ